jgi:Right handed beta helix region
MGRRGKLEKGLLSAFLVLAIVPASAGAASVINVDETTDAPLNSGATTCKSTSVAEGCTLRAAVELADSEGQPATIEVPEGTYAETEGPLFIENDATVTIKGAGAGAGKTIVEGNGTSVVLEVEEDSGLILNGVTVRNGSEDEGGGIYVSSDASLLVENSELTDNEATDEGGAIYGEFHSSITVRNSTVTGNSAGHAGGGIFAEPESTVAVEGSTISRNEAGQRGGGIEMQTSEDCERDLVSHNGHARRATQPIAQVFPGGLTVAQSSIEGNTVNDGQGGGIYVTEEDCRIEAARGHAAKAHPNLQLISDGEPNLLITQTTIAHNEAAGEDGEGQGGGIYEEAFFDDPIVDSTIADNFATVAGGGVYVEEGETALVSDTVAHNGIEPEEEIRIEAKPDIARDNESLGSNLATRTDADAWIELRNTIVTEPSADTGNCEGNIESLEEGAGYNLDDPSTEGEGSVDSCGMSEADHDLLGVDPGLDPSGLQNNGGPTATIALSATSPAIGVVPIKEDCEDEGDGPALPTEDGAAAVDQRGAPRPGIAGRGCDIGAYEYQAPAVKKAEEPAPTPTPKPTPISGVLPFKASAPECASKRDIVVHIQNVKQLGVVSAVISIDGHARRTLSGRQLRTAIDLIGLPKGTFTVEIVAHTRGGKTLRGKRVYHTCHTRLPGHSRLYL